MFRRCKIPVESVTQGQTSLFTWTFLGEYLLKTKRWFSEMNLICTRKTQKTYVWKNAEKSSKHRFLSAIFKTDFTKSENRRRPFGKRMQILLSHGMNFCHPLGGKMLFKCQRTLSTIRLYAILHTNSAGNRGDFLSNAFTSYAYPLFRLILKHIH